MKKILTSAAIAFSLYSGSLHAEEKPAEKVSEEEEVVKINSIEDFKAGQIFTPYAIYDIANDLGITNPVAQFNRKYTIPSPRGNIPVDHAYFLTTNPDENTWMMVKKTSSKTYKVAYSGSYFTDTSQRHNSIPVNQENSVPIMCTEFPDDYFWNNTILFTGLDDQTGNMIILLSPTTMNSENNVGHLGSLLIMDANYSCETEILTSNLTTEYFAPAPDPNKELATPFPSRP